MDDAALRAMQHLMVDLVDCLDDDTCYEDVRHRVVRCVRSNVYCDCKCCQTSDEEEVMKRDNTPGLRWRYQSRWNDNGLWSSAFKEEDVGAPRRYAPKWGKLTEAEYVSRIDLSHAKKMSLNRCKKSCLDLENMHGRE